MTHLDLSKLAQLCRDATRPWHSDVWIETDGGGWRATGPHHEDDASDRGSEPGGLDEQAAQRDAAYIAAASPDLIALLVSVAQAAEKCVDERRATIMRARETTAMCHLAAAIDALRGRVGK
jgi:hypothetical protein